MQAETELKFTPRPSSIHGHGNFAEKSFDNGELITIIVGEIVSGDELDKSLAKMELGIDDDLQVGINLYLIPEDPWRYFNHSCDPNSGVRASREMLALKVIHSGEEITMDYSTVVGSHSTWTMPCSCGSENCRSIVGSILTLPKSRLQFNMENNALPNFIIDELKILEIVKL